MSATTWWILGLYKLPLLLLLFNCYIQVFREIKVKNFDASNYVTEQVFYESRDKTKIPMFTVHRKVTELFFLMYPDRQVPLCVDVKTLPLFVLIEYTCVGSNHMSNIFAIFIRPDQMIP